MKKSLAVVIALALAVVAVWAFVSLRRIGLARLRVVLAADPGTASTESFRKLLSEHAKSVTVIPVLELAKADLSEADVLIVGGRTMDWVDGKMKMQPGPAAITLDTLSVPTVLIGGMGARIADSLDLKLGWRHG